MLYRVAAEYDRPRFRINHLKQPLLDPGHQGRGALELANEPTAAPSILLALMQSVNQFTFRSKYESLMFGSVQSAARERCLNKLRREMLA